jgi:hypothetical protein
MTSGPILRAQPENGRSWDDPSAELLLTLLEEIESGQGTFLIVTRTTDPNGQTYAQALRREDGQYIVEYRDGEPERHYGTVVADLKSAHALLTGWAFETPGWNDAASWAPVEV